MQDGGRDAFFDRWMGLLAAAAIGDLERPTLQADYGATPEPDVELDEPEASSESGMSDNSLLGRLRRT